MSEPQIVLREAQPYLGIRERLTDGIRDFADSAFPELFGWVFENGVAPAGPPFLRYHEIDTPVSRLTSRPVCRSRTCRPPRRAASAHVPYPRGAT
jgi:hypothetical protein